MTEKNNNDSIKGKAVIVTGSVGGLGFAVGRKLAAEGCKVMLNALCTPEEGQAKAREIETEFRVPVKFHGADLSEPKQIEDLVRFTESELGPVEILVNNAVMRNFGAVDKITTEGWNKAVAVNLNAPFHLIRLTFPGMKSRKWGRIINISSNWGLTGTIDRADYVATKHGVVGLTRAVGLEGLPYNVTANAICPASVLTPHAERQVRERMARDNQNWDEAAAAFLKTRQPSGRFVMPEKIADLIVFLCSSSASEMTAAPIAMDGGWLSI